MAEKRSANVRWTGDLMSGSGVVTAATSGAFREQPVTWAARSTSAHEGKTSPEELLAAAHAACFAMAFSGRLAKNRTPSTSLDVQATVSFAQVGQGFRVTSSHLRVDAVVPGLDEPTFLTLAEEAKKNCPLSQALAGNVEIDLVASLIKR